MGGKKKLNLKQMERMQDKKDTEDKEKEKKKKDKPTGQPKEKKPLSIMPPDAKNEKILGELKKMSVLTPYVVASRFGIRMSAAKVFLRQLEEGGKIQRVSGSHNIKIYKVD